MGKVVKAVLQVAAIAVNFIPGIGQLASFAISAALAIGASQIKIGAKAPRNSPENQNRLRANIDPLTPRKTVVGITALATDIRDEEFTNDQTYFHRFIVCASHKVQSIDEIWFDDKRVWTSAGGVEGDAVGYLTVATRTEGSAANAINISARMGTTRRYTGLAYVHLRYKLTGNSKKAESPYAQSITTRITIRGKAAFLPDPRDPAQDMEDQSTWTWDADACRNPALALLFYLLGWRINGELAIGKGIPPSRIDLDSFITAANLCDEPVDKIGGGTEPRYRCDGAWSEADDPTTVIDMLKATMNADLDDVGGKLRLTVFHNDLATPVVDFNDNDIIDGFTWQAQPPLDATFNVVRGLYTDASDASLYQQADYPEQREDSPDDIDRLDTFNLPMVQSAGQAQRLAALRLARQQYGGVFEAEFQATGWKVSKNSIVRLSFSQTGFTTKFFRVAEMEVRQDGVVPLKLREEDPAIYGDPPITGAISPIFSTPYDPALNPLVQAINLNEQTLIAISSQVGISITATDDTITVSAHDREYRDKLVPIAGVVITTDAAGGTLVPDTTYYLYYDDGDRDGLNGLDPLEWKATTDFNAAQNSAVNPARHFAGIITTDVIGGTGTVGSGVGGADSIGAPGPAGVDGLSGFLTNEAHTVAVDAAGSFSLTSAGGTFRVFSGQADKTGAAGPTIYAVVGGSAVGSNSVLAQNGLTMSINTTTGVYNLSGAWGGSSTETFTLRATFAGVDIDRIYSIAKSAAGQDGPSAGEFVIYQRATSIPSTPSGGFVNFSTGTLGIPSGWSSAIPAGTDPVYASRGFAQTNTPTVNTTIFWGTPVRVFQDGAPGAPGEPGDPGPPGDNGAPGAPGTPAITGFLTNENFTVFAFANGNVVSYTGATGSFRVFQGNSDVSANFSLSTVSNPQSLTVSYSSQTYTVTGGLDNNEDTATLTIRATGSGAFSGITIDKVFSLAKAKGGYEIVASLPVTNLFEGRMVFLTSDDKLYRYTGSAWTAAVPAVDISGQLADAQIAALAASKVTGQLSDAQIAAIAAAKLTGQITGTQITNGAISTAKLAAGAVTAAEIAAGAVIADKISANAVTAVKISAGAVEAAKIAAGAIEADKIAANAVIAGKIAANAVTATTIASNAIIADKIDAGAITAAKLAATSVITLSAQINDALITSAKVANLAVTNAKIADLTVDNLKLSSGAVLTDKLASNAVTVGTYASAAGPVTLAKNSSAWTTFLTFTHTDTGQGSLIFFANFLYFFSNTTGGLESPAFRTRLVEVVGGTDTSRLDVGQVQIDVESNRTIRENVGFNFLTAAAAGTRTFKLQGQLVFNHTNDGFVGDITLSCLQIKR